MILITSNVVAVMWVLSLIVADFEVLLKRFPGAR